MIKMIKMTAIVVMTIALVFASWKVPFAANTDSHTVTVTVAAINELAINGGNVTLTINSATAGSEPNNGQDSTCDLLWTTNESGKKITVQTNLGAPIFTLKVVAQNVTGVGTAAAEFTLSTTATDFVTGVATTTGNCDLQYTAVATAAQGTGTDTHTVTYTLTN